MKTEQQIKDHLDSLNRQRSDYDRIVKTAIKLNKSEMALHAALKSDILTVKIEEITWTLKEES